MVYFGSVRVLFRLVVTLLVWGALCPAQDGKGMDNGRPLPAAEVAPDCKSMHVEADSREKCNEALRQMREDSCERLVVDCTGAFTVEEAKACVRSEVLGDADAATFATKEKQLIFTVNWGAHVELAYARRNLLGDVRLGERAQRCYNKAKYIIEKLVKDDMSDMEKALVLHDYLVLHTVYDMKYLRKGAEGVLLLGRGVCDGYTQAYAMLLRMVGVECRCVSGSAGGAHAWNMVKIDGKWYHVDVTWDDPIGGRQRKEYLHYEFFMISDKEIRSRRHRWDWDYTPATPSLSPKYFLKRKRSYVDVASFLVGAERAYQTGEPFFRAHLKNAKKQWNELARGLYSGAVSFEIRGATYSKDPADIVTLVYKTPLRASAKKSDKKFFGLDVGELPDIKLRDKLPDKLPDIAVPFFD